MTVSEKIEITDNDIEQNKAQTKCHNFRTIIRKCY